MAKFNPMAGLRTPIRTRHQRLLDAQEKGKALTDTELLAVWRAAQAPQDRATRGEQITGAFGGLVQLALLTAMRRGELSQLQRDRHILTGDRAVEARGIEGERIHLPKTITKTVADHDIPLPAADARGHRGTAAEHPPADVSIAHHRRPAQGLDEAGGGPEGDQRRRCRAARPAAHIAEDIAELAIGHQRADLVARYNKDAAWPAPPEETDGAGEREEA